MGYPHTIKPFTLHLAGYVLTSNSGVFIRTVFVMDKHILSTQSIVSHNYISLSCSKYLWQRAKHTLLPKSKTGKEQKHGTLTLS
jgi:hypothetical protein